MANHHFLIPADKLDAFTALLHKYGIRESAVPSVCGTHVRVSLLNESIPANAQHPFFAEWRQILLPRIQPSRPSLSRSLIERMALAITGIYPQSAKSCH